MKILFRIVSVVAILGAVGGCASSPSPQLVVSSTRDLIDETVVAPEMQGRTYRRIMVLPPSGTVRGEFDRRVGFFERELVKKGTVVVSGAVTGRVISEYRGAAGRDGGQQSAADTAARLSDAERALVMAKTSGADGILQIGFFNYRRSPTGRSFIWNPESGKFSEVPGGRSREEPYRLDFPTQWLDVSARLIDVQSGNVMISFKLGAGVNFNLPSDYVAAVKFRRVGDRFVGQVIKENYLMLMPKPAARKPAGGAGSGEKPVEKSVDADWEVEAKERLEERVFEALAGHITSR